MKKEYYAHSREGKTPENWHRLEGHLKSVAEMAHTFANDFNAGDWGYLAWLIHRNGIETGLGYVGGNSVQVLKKDVANIEQIVMVIWAILVGSWLPLRYLKKRRSTSRKLSLCKRIDFILLSYTIGLILGTI